ncbi:MAG: heme ABC exporter ATP-binding protein CcmA [Methylocystis sp.]
MNISPSTPSCAPTGGSQPLRLCVEGLSVQRAGRRIIDNIGFKLTEGEALVVCGRNGAGKSTLLRALAGLLPTTQGVISLNKGVLEVELAQNTHYLAHADGMKLALSVEENLNFWANYLAGPFHPRSQSIPQALSILGLTHALRAPFGALSAGQKRRAALARLLVVYRPLWLLDEPMTALDQASRTRLAQAMRAHCAEGGIIVVATHEPLGFVTTRELAL